MGQARGTFSSQLTPQGMRGQIQDELSLTSQCLCPGVPHPHPQSAHSRRSQGWTSSGRGYLGGSALLSVVFAPMAERIVWPP